MADQKITDLTTDSSPTDDDLLVTVNDPAGTPANRKVTVADLSAKVASDVASAGTALTDISPASGAMDADDTVYGEEDTNPRKFTRAQLLGGIGPAAGAMDADDIVYGEEDGSQAKFTRGQIVTSTTVDTAGAVMESDYDAQTILRATTDNTPTALTVGEQTIVGRVTGGNIAALTQAQLLNNLLNGSAMSGDVTISNATGRRIVLKNAQLVNDIALQVFLDNDDTQPALSIETIIGVAAQISLGPGGSTATDTVIQRAGAGVVAMSGVQIVPGGSASTQGRVGGRIEDVTTGVGNVGTGEDTLTTITLAASTLSATGQAVRARFAGTIANNANAKRIRLKFGTTTLLDTGASGIATSVALDWTAQYTIVRTGAATQKAFAELKLSNGTNFVDYTEPTETLSATKAVFCTGEATSNDDVRCEVMLVDWEGASPQ